MADRIAREKALTISRSCIYSPPFPADERSEYMRTER
jgi:hypothetical protein